MENIYPIQAYDNQFSQSGTIVPNPVLFRQKERQQQQQKKNAKKKFNDLARLANDKHLNLVENDLPYRLCVYQQNSDVYMDVVSLKQKKQQDHGEKMYHIFHRNVSKDDADDLVRSIHKGVGLIFDYRL